MKNINSPDWCYYCKEPIESKEGYVVDTEQHIYHLLCYHTIKGIFSLEITEEN